MSNFCGSDSGDSEESLRQRCKMAILCTMKSGLLLVVVASVSGMLCFGRQGTRPVGPATPMTAATMAAQRAVLDQYCVTCHNDKTRRANLSLEKLDLSQVGDHAELWEKVVRKLRAGVMPPPGI